MRCRTLASVSVALLIAVVPSAVSRASVASGARLRARTTCNGTWSVEPSPNVSDGDNSLYGVAAISSSDVWAVGIKIPKSGTKPLTEHWDGAAWNVVETPFVGDAQLNGVAAVSSSDVWAVGYRQSFPDTPLTYHWDGAAWNLVRTPTPGEESILVAVSAASADDVWAVGYVRRIAGERSLVMHWDGNAWTVVPSPSVGRRNTEMTGIDAVSADDVWAVGNGYDAHLNASPAVMHWDGTSWQLVPPPAIDHPWLAAVSGTASDDVWAVGSYGTPGLSQTLTLHWNGTDWSVVPSPDPGTSWHTLWSVDTVSAQLAWAAGWYIVGFELYPVILVWDGTQWAVDPSPVPNPSNYNYLYGISADSSSDTWAVGDFVDPVRQVHSTLTEHSCD